MRSHLFFRLDDVFDDTPSLRAVVGAFLERNLPLHCSVVPGKLESSVASFLQDARGRSGEIEIGQHGWKHLDHGGGGEFGGNRSYEEQIVDIALGKRILDETFGADGWVPVFTPPWGKWNADTLRALEETGFKVLSAGFPDSRSQRWLAPFAKFLKRTEFRGAPLSYHPGPVAGSDEVIEVSVAVDMGGGYPGGHLRPLEMMMDEVKWAARRMQEVGVLLHPAHFMDPKSIGVLGRFLESASERNSPESLIRIAIGIR